MKNNSPAFSLIELLIATTLSSFVILAMFQCYRNTDKFMNICRQIMSNDRKVCFFFNQIERDFTSVVMQPLVPDPKPSESDEKKDDTEAKKQAEDKEKKKKDEKEVNFYFLALPHETEEFKVGSKKHKLLKSLNFVTTNALTVYGERRVRLVRVSYELELDKEKGKKGKMCYRLWRKETTNLKNKKLREEEQTVRTKAKRPEAIRRHLIADNIRELSLEFQTPRDEIVEGKPGRSTSKSSDNEEPYRSFEWGKEEETVKKIPQQINLYVTLWNSSLENTYPFACTMPIISFWPNPAAKKEEKKVEEPAPAADQPHQQGGPAPAAPGGHQ